MLTPTPLPSVRAITPHMVGMPRMDGVAEVIKLCSNESPLGPGALARAAMVCGLRPMAHHVEDAPSKP